MDKIYLIAFEMTHAALAAETVLNGAGIPSRLAPTPADISAGCGFCLAVAPDDRQRAEDALRAAGAEYSGVYEHSAR